MLRKKRAQSTLEYIVVVTAIVGAIIAWAAVVARHNKNVGLGKVFYQAGERIKSDSGKIADITP